ncbi:MAG: hypothetical protein M3N97_03910 [Pseudomonadota bacterium]|nr:hypothetical protein [Pseudomonadota bacterium]
MVALEGAAIGQATSEGLAVRTVAEIETVVQDGHPVVKLQSAGRVVPGDQVIYTLEIRNIGAATVREPIVVNPIPAHMAYIADSAAGPGAQASYSWTAGIVSNRRRICGWH